MVPVGALWWSLLRYPRLLLGGGYLVNLRRQLNRQNIFAILRLFALLPVNPARLFPDRNAPAPPG
jgi:hypothetical protein